MTDEGKIYLQDYTLFSKRAVFPKRSTGMLSNMSLYDVLANVRHPFLDGMPTERFGNR
jgi:hypothetical protein